MAAIVASKVKRIRKQRDADSQQNLRTAVIHGNSQINSRGRGDSLFENGGEASPSNSILDFVEVFRTKLLYLTGFAD